MGVKVVFNPGGVDAFARPVAQVYRKEADTCVEGEVDHVVTTVVLAHIVALAERGQLSFAAVGVDADHVNRAHLFQKIHRSFALVECRSDQFPTRVVAAAKVLQGTGSISTCVGHFVGFPVFRLAAAGLVEVQTGGVVDQLAAGFYYVGVRCR